MKQSIVEDFEKEFFDHSWNSIVRTENFLSVQLDSQTTYLKMEDFKFRLKKLSLEIYAVYILDKLLSLDLEEVKN